MKAICAALLCALLITTVAMPGSGEEATGSTDRTGVSIVETGTGKDSQPLFTIQADRADLAEILKALFVKTGEAFTIAQDVSGPVDLKIKNATLEQAILRVAEVARPTLRITRDAEGYHASRAFDSHTAAADVLARMSPGATRPGYPRTNPVTPIPLRSDAIPTDRFVTLDIPDERPVPLAELLSAISAQTRFPVTLDPRVPRDLTYSVTLTQASLPLVLQTIAATTGLKVIANGYRAMLVPTDQFIARWGRTPIGQSPGVVCQRCGHALVQGWSFCPYCGAPVPRAAPGKAGGALTPRR